MAGPLSPPNTFPSSGRRLPGRPGRRVTLDHRIDARVLEADRVQHSGGRFGDSGGDVADTRLQRRALAAYGSQALDVDHLAVLDAIAEGARGDQDRVGQA